MTVGGNQLDAARGLRAGLRRRPGRRYSVTVVD